MDGAKGAAKLISGGLIAKLTEAVYDILALAGWGVAIVVAATAALVFFTFAAFLWVEQNLGTLNAALVLGGFFLLVAVLILVTLLVLRRRGRRRKRRDPQWWQDPAVVATGVELVRVVGLKRIIPVVALGAAIVGAMQGRPHRTGR